MGRWNFTRLLVILMGWITANYVNKISDRVNWVIVCVTFVYFVYYTLRTNKSPWSTITDLFI